MPLWSIARESVVGCVSSISNTFFVPLESTPNNCYVFYPDHINKMESKPNPDTEIQRRFDKCLLHKCWLFGVVGVNCSLMGNIRCLCTVNPTHKITKYACPCFLTGNDYFIETTCNLSANIRSLITGTQLSQFICNYTQFSPIVPLCTMFGTPSQLKLCFLAF